MTWPNEFPEGTTTHTSIPTKRKQTLKTRERKREMQTSSHSSIDASVDLVPTSTFDTFLVFWKQREICQIKFHKIRLNTHNLKCSKQVVGNSIGDGFYLGETLNLAVCP